MINLFLILPVAEDGPGFEYGQGKRFFTDCDKSFLDFACRGGGFGVRIRAGEEIFY